MFKKLFGKKSGPLKNRVVFCVSNPAFADPEVYDVLEQREDVTVEETGCNSYCEICERHYYALVNGEPVAADSAKELLEKIEEELELNPIE
ncbi:DUF1450 domain-containing protein [Ureibacillus sp. FSL K6-8385]|uniref:DUF1450 domain-containing protein n=1 Tax=Ureibacillus terrenus TaxID=118246 RepID=A0A540V5H9_9BACL|nr:DUF1450 domain-containing protein [Ureibacillus terrenus]MED3661225.1 DUF1450 domain-containing protein [Ureibacillus terrenus]MED3764300.1 DUF1450 domain-containing protein [Ureibacillus terrenus]TQE92016.1 DUF1450 domain-containing protein [Ureibacillus terrenus]